MPSFRCVSGCDLDADVFTPLFSCPTCDGLIDVAHDEEVWAARSAEEWRALLDARAQSVSAVDRSGVWAHREWVMPSMAAEDIVTLGEGRAPLDDAGGVTARVGVRKLSIKQCGQSPTGSFKDLGMTVLVSMANAMRRQGRDVRALVCASTGDTSAAVAAYGARAKIPVVVLLPAGKISMAQLVQPVAQGAHVLALDGDFDRCMAIVKSMERTPGVFLANSKNPLRLEGQKTVAFEIARERNWEVPDFVVVPSGNLGNIAALESGFRTLLSLKLTTRMPRLVAAQVDAANPLFQSFQAGLETLTPMTAKETRASAIRIGNPVSFPRAKRALLSSNGLVSSVSENELLASMAAADGEGFFVCPHTATAIAGVSSLVKTGAIKKDADVVVVSTAHGLKFSDQKVRFHDGTDVVTDDAIHALRNPPRVMKADVSVVQKALDAVLS